MLWVFAVANRGPKTFNVDTKCLQLRPPNSINRLNCFCFSFRWCFCLCGYLCWHLWSSPGSTEVSRSCDLVMWSPDLTCDSSTLSHYPFWWVLYLVFPPLSAASVPSATSEKKLRFLASDISNLLPWIRYNYIVLYHYVHMSMCVRKSTLKVRVCPSCEKYAKLQVGTQKHCKPHTRSC